MTNNLPLYEEEAKWKSLAELTLQRSPTPPHALHDSFKKLSLSRLFASNLLVLLLQFTGLTLTTLSAPLTLMWYASGTAIGFCFLRGYSILPGIFLGSLLAYYYAGATLSLNLLSSSLCTFQPGVLLWLSYQFISPTLIFHSRITAFKWIGYSLLVTGGVSFLLMLCAYPNLSTPLPFLPLWQSAWCANFLGLTIFGFALIALDAYFPQMAEMAKHGKMKLVANYSAIVGLSIALLLIQSPYWIGLFAFLMSIALVNIPFSYKYCGFVAALFIQGMILSLGNLFTGWDELSVFLQLFLVMECIAGLWLI